MYSKIFSCIPRAVLVNLFCLHTCQDVLVSRAIGFYVLNIVMVHAVIIIMNVRVLKD